MFDTYETLVHWQDPTGKFHNVGEVAEIDPVAVFDLADLVRIGTVRKVEMPNSPQGESPITPTATTDAVPLTAIEGVG